MAAAKLDYRHAVLDAGVLDRLHRVLGYWQDQGLAFAPLPWFVPPAIMNHTKPAWAEGPDPATREGPLVASGEQSFLWLFEQGLLAPSAKGYIGWSPCFRHEVYDDYHHHYFIKAELFVPTTAEVAPRVLESLLQHSRRVFRELADDPRLPVERRAMEDQIDLELDTIELGSYGIRLTPSGQVYVFGTALAEPRWSKALADYRAHADDRF